MRFTLVLAAALSAATGAAAQPAGKLLLDSRLRYEAVEQAGFAREAEALTWRNRIGFETAEKHGLRGLIEVEDVRRLGLEHHNITIASGASVNGRTQYPAISDPETTELNRAQISWKANDHLAMTLGRQRVVIDDQRFVGSTTWRQDDVSYDGFKADVTMGKVTGVYAYLAHVNRSQGTKADVDLDTHAFNLGYAFSNAAKLQAFAYLEDFSNAPVSSNQTYGAKLSGRAKLDETTLAYNATFANQTDYRGNTAPFDLNYYGGDLTVAHGIWAGRVSYEVLEGDGARGFITPLASNHGYQGWADAFSAVGGAKTFVDGIEDLNFQVGLKPRFKSALVSNPVFMARYHDFDAVRTGADIAHEWNAEAGFAITPKLNFSFQYADFQTSLVRLPGTAAPPASRTKYFVILEYKL